MHPPPPAAGTTSRLRAALLVGFLAVVACTPTSAPSPPPPATPTPVASPDFRAEQSTQPPQRAEASATWGDEILCPNPSAPGVFVDVTESAGLVYVSQTPAVAPLFDGTADYTSADVESAGGFGAGDLDGDGHIDLLFTDSRGPMHLFLGDGALGFESVIPTHRGLPAGGVWRHSISLVDVEGDGDLDVYLLNRFDNELFLNDGAGMFSDATEAFGLGDGQHRSLTASWADYDRDSDLDLFVANWGAGSDGAEGKPFDRDALYVQRAPGVFEFSDALPPSPGFAFVGGWFDADDDGWLDLYVANDVATQVEAHAPNVFLRNAGGPPDRVLLVPAPEAGLDRRMLGMGLGLGDLDGDGDVDVHVSNAGPTFVARNDGEWGFVDLSAEAAGMTSSAEADISWSTFFFDHDNDGAEELFIAYGHMPTKVFDPTGPDGSRNALLQPDRLLSRNPDSGAWQDLAAHVGLDDDRATRTAVAVDLNRDGFPELLSWALYEGPRLSRAPCNANGWLTVQLELPNAGNRSAIGARVEAWDGDTLVASRTVFAGSEGQATSRPPEVYLGLGLRDEVDLVVRWPDGATTRTPGLPTRRLAHVVREQ